MNIIIRPEIAAERLNVFDAALPEQFVIDKFLYASDGCLAMVIGSVIGFAHLQNGARIEIKLDVDPLAVAAAGTRIDRAVVAVTSSTPPDSGAVSPGL